MKKKQKIGLFPGCFDPFHNQHHNIVKNLLKNSQLNLDQIWILVNGSSQEKKLVGSFEERWKIIHQLWKDQPRVYLYPEAIPFYTTELIKKMQKSYPNWQFYLVLGTDQINQLLTWKNLGNLKNLLTIIAIEREGFPLQKKITKIFQIYSLPMNVINNISSTEIRKGRNWKTSLHPQTYLSLDKNSRYSDYIQENQKYQKVLEANIAFLPRREHCQNTANLAKKLAVRFNYPQWADRLYNAGLLHDIAKEWKDEKFFAFYQKHQLPWKKLITLPRPVWHAQAGAFFCTKELNINDQDILTAIEYHTTAKKPLNDFAKILFLADKLEVAKKEKIFSKMKTNLFNPKISLKVLFQWTLASAYQKILNKGLIPTTDTLEAYHYYCNNQTDKNS